DLLDGPAFVPGARRRPPDGRLVDARLVRRLAGGARPSAAAARHGPVCRRFLADHRARSVAPPALAGASPGGDMSESPRELRVRTCPRGSRLVPGRGRPPTVVAPDRRRPHRVAGRVVPDSVRARALV